MTVSFYEHENMLILNKKIEAGENIGQHRFQKNSKVIKHSLILMSSDLYESVTSFLNIPMIIIKKHILMGIWNNNLDERRNYARIRRVNHYYSKGS